MAAMLPGLPARTAAAGMPRTPPGRVRLQTLVSLRWVAVTGQGLALLLVHYGLGFALPLAPALAVVGVSTLLNVALFLVYPTSRRLTDMGATLLLGFDLVQLLLLLALTGGLDNPFAILVLVPVTISATILSLRSTVLLGVLALVGLSLIGAWHWPLPWPEPGITLPQAYRVGIWIALVLGTGFIAVYAWQVAAETRRMSDALAASQMALARERELSALGALAAAAAHELGTPLGTIAVAAKELVGELPPDSSHAEDMRLIVAQAERCRDILARLSRRPADRQGEGFGALPFAVMVQAAAEPHMRGGVEFRIEVIGQGRQPAVIPRPEIIQGLGNIFENAADFARSQVIARVDWTAREIRLAVLDDGPGINVDILSALGEPYITSRPEGGGMGLGVFIAKTLLEHTGASVGVRNRSGGGAEVEVVWSRPGLESAGPTTA